MRRCLGLLVLLCLLPVGMAHGDGDGHAVFEERLLEDALGPMDLHGTRLAWAALRDGQVELVVTDLVDGAESTATRVPVDGERSVQSLAFDGRWLAWTDDRFGNLDPFAVDTETGRLLRLSDHSSDDEDVDVEDGRFAWVRKGGGVMLADDAGVAQEVIGGGVASEPAFAGGWLAWSQIEGERRVIRGQYLADGSVHTVADDKGVIHAGLDGAPDGHLIWGGTVDDKARIHARPLLADGTMGETRVLTDWGVFVVPRTGGGHGAWLGSGHVYVERFSDGHASTVEPYRPPFLSSDLLVVTRPGADGIRVTPTPWADWDAGLPVEPRDPRPYLVAAGVAVLVGGAALQWLRARRQSRD